MQKLVALLVMILLCSGVFAQVGDDPIISRVNDAEARCEKEIDDAKAVEATAETKALTDLLAVLETAKKDETNTHRALELDSRIKIVRDRLGILTGKKLTLEVFGDKDWQPLGPVVKGQHLYMTAAGSWMGDVNDEATRCGPSGRLGDGKWKLVAHIDDDWFNIGSGLELIVPRSGTLEFSMNDSPGHKKGSGKLTVTVVLVN